MASFAHANGLTLHYRLEGRGAVALVFINSLGSDLRIWEDLTAELAPHFRLLRYDKRGHGLSDAPPAPYTLRDHTQDLKALLEHLGIPRAILVGISVGGLIALDFALAYPAHAEALVLCDTGARIGSEASWNQRIAAIRQQGLAEVAKSVIERWFTPGFFAQHPARAQGYYNMLSRTPVEGYIGTCMALRGADLRGEVGNIRAKTLVLCGAEDRSTPPSLATELAQSLGAPLKLIEHAAHLPCIEQPGAMLRAIRAFLEELGYA